VITYDTITVFIKIARNSINTAFFIHLNHHPSADYHLVFYRLSYAVETILIPRRKPTMSLDRSQVEIVAKLARLKIDESELPDYVDSISNILELVDKMQAVDTTGIEPLANPLDAAQRLRPDVVTEENKRDQLQANAPKAEKGLFLVPKVID